MDAKVEVHKITAWLMREFGKNIASSLDVLPQKARRIPHVLWMAPPTHKYFSNYNNDQRIIQTECLQEIVRTLPEMTVLKLVKVWDKDNSNLFLRDAYKFTSEGLTAYWVSVDSAIKFWFEILSKKQVVQRSQFKKINRQNKDKFHWNNRGHHHNQHQHRNSPHSRR